jgi:hypothetical protein
MPPPAPPLARIGSEPESGTTTATRFTEAEANAIPPEAPKLAHSIPTIRSRWYGPGYRQQGPTKSDDGYSEKEIERAKTGLMLGFWTAALASSLRFGGDDDNREPPKVCDTTPDAAAPGGPGR